MNATIVGAIQNKEVLSLVYDGISREVEPHTYGVNSRGNEVLRCYQVSGGHTSERSTEWDLLKVSKIVALAKTGARFAAPRPGYKRGDRGMVTIYQEL